MLSRQEEAAIQTDAYIDALLAAHAGSPVALPARQALPSASLRQAIELLEKGLPRIHPSFRFEAQLAARLRRAALAQQAGRPLPIAEIIPLPPNPGYESADEEFAAMLPSALPALALDRRLLVGGAIASGVSLAGAAMIAWRMRERSRTRGHASTRRRLLA